MAEQWIAYALDRKTQLVRSLNLKAITRYVRTHQEKVSFVLGPDGTEYNYHRSSAELLPVGDERWQRRSSSS